MRWNNDNESPDVIDRRGQSGGGGGAGLGGLLFFLPFLMRSKFGWLILLGIAGYYAYTTFGGGSADTQQTHGPASHAAAGARSDDQLAHFVGFVLDDAQATWTRELPSRQQQYRHAKLVLFTNSTQTGCGYGQAATGPFYCPSDERVYIDLGFFRQLSDKLGARGDFAQAYVVAHEIGHHVQKILGISDKVAHAHGPTEGATGASVRLELQADCFAGVWAHSTEQRNLLEQGDIDQAMRAATAIGDDRLQKQSTGTVSPETWTHGSSAQRTGWFGRGYKSGRIEDCDTFAASSLLAPGPAMPT